MFAVNSSSLSSPPNDIVRNFNSLSNYGPENNHIGPLHTSIFSLDSFEENNESIQEIIPSNSLNMIPSIIDPDPMPSYREVRNVISYVPINSNKQSESNSPLDSANSPTKDESSPILFKEKENLIGKKRQKRKRHRKEDKDDIRVKIKRSFLNIFIKNKLNKLLRRIGSKKYFDKFPKYFASDSCQKRNKEIINLSLRQIFIKIELYKYEDENGYSKFLHNFKVVQNEEIQKNEEFQKILNKTFSELYEEYINSDEFKIVEINRIKKKITKDDYIKKYKELAATLIEFFKNEKN